jgi:hypothetical protein
VELGGIWYKIIKEIKKKVVPKVHSKIKKPPPVALG